MKISKAEIERLKTEKMQENLGRLTRERERTKQDILAKLATSKYFGVLEIVLAQNIEIPKSYLRELAAYESMSGSSDHVGLAIQAYQKIGDNRKARGLQERLDYFAEVEYIQGMVEGLTK